jgi:tetratricopeptide (TPR) repeat protein
LGRPRKARKLPLAFAKREAESGAMLKPARLLALTFALFGPVASVSAADDNPFGTSDPYRTCVAAIDRKADDAFEMALTWRDHGGGLPAEHCAALALIALDEPGEAASRLDQLAQRADAGTDAQRAAILTQSGNAWLLASQPENAENAFGAALKLAPRDAGLWADRGRARAARQDWADAENDLSAALAYDKTHPATYVLRASARHAQGNLRGYRADIEAALSLDATFPEALVERGAMKMDAGDVVGARADFLQVLLRAPDSAAADIVRKRIEALEVHDP